MKKIVTVVKPFVMDQHIFVYENGNKIDLVTCKLEEVPAKMLELCSKHSSETIELVGPKNYNKGIKKQIKELEMTKYNKEKINIILL